MTPKVVATAVATCLTLGIAGAPAQAAKSKKKPKVTVTSVNKKVTGVQKSVKKLDTSIKALDVIAKRADANSTSANQRLDVLFGALPSVVDGLTQLKDASLALKAGLEQAGAGLVKLQDAVEKQIAPNLQNLGDAYQAVEYGRAGLFATGGTVAAGGSVTSADIPDDGNTITATEDAVVVATATGVMQLQLRAAIRSAEPDGASASDTAGQAGGFLSVRDESGALVGCMGAPAPGVVGTQAGEEIVTPTGKVTNLSLVNIAGGVARTDQAEPTAGSKSLLGEATPCAINATAGDIYTVHYSVNFADIPTSATPGPRE